MLRKTITYKSLIRIIGILFMLLSVYCFCSVALHHTEAIDNGVTIYSGPEIGESVSRTFLGALWLRGGYYGSLFSWGGTLTYMGIGILLVGLSTMKAKVAYWTLQAAIWLIGINLWYQYGGGGFSNSIISFLVTPLSLWPWMIIVLAISFVLMAAYIPVVRLLNRFFSPLEQAETRTEAISEKMPG